MKKHLHPTILLVGKNFLESVNRCKYFLRDEPLQIIHASTGEAALSRLKQTAPEIVLLDLDLPDISGIKVLQYIHDQKLNSAVIVITTDSSVSWITEIMDYGALDFIEKPFNESRLCLTLRNILKYKNLSQIVESYKTSFESGEYYGFIGNSQAMQTIYRIIDNVATSKASVFITGESGTGKDLCAEAIHKRSKRKDGPFVALNCAAIPKDLAESQIFGHVKGAFSGAITDHQGAAQQAHLGTFFLDEIGDMDINLQSKLLRFIQTGTFQKVGGNKLEKVDVRFICATNRNPLAEVQVGRFREDLYYRLSVISMGLPALRKREEDVLLIAKKFLNKYAQEEGKTFLGFAKETEEILSQYSWPGNVRQLQNVIHNVVVMHQGGVITPAMLPPPLDNLHTTTQQSSIPSSFTDQETPPFQSSVKKVVLQHTIRPLRLAEKTLIEEAIESCAGDVAKAALLLGVSASTIYRKLRTWKDEEQV
jgi:DNA-binding NtrC family response regulator